MAQACGGCLARGYIAIRRARHRDRRRIGLWPSWTGRGPSLAGPGRSSTSRSAASVARISTSATSRRSSRPGLSRGTRCPADRSARRGRVGGWGEGDRVSVLPFAQCGECDACRSGAEQVCGTAVANGVGLGTGRPRGLCRACDRGRAHALRAAGCGRRSGGDARRADRGRRGRAGSRAPRSGRAIRGHRCGADRPPDGARRPRAGRRGGVDLRATRVAPGAPSAWACGPWLRPRPLPSWPPTRPRRSWSAPERERQSRWPSSSSPRSAGCSWSAWRSSPSRSTSCR